MALSESEVFEPLTLAEVTAATAKEATDKVDHEWADRIKTLAIGGGFRIRRSEGEPTRTLKTRINRAAFAAFRELAWYPQEGNLTDGKPASYVVKVKSIDTKREAEAATSQNGQNGPSQPAQPTPPAPTTDPSSPEPETAGGPRVGRR